jgi:exodeoxyribonuclease V alpha subunit
VACITGGAGSGKTTALAALCEHPTARERGVLLLAPTGKAAARISEKTRRPASTIHRALGWEPRLRKVRYDAVTPWSQRQIVCDEASMVDALLAADLIEAASEGAHVTFVGDVNQLPPVGPGAPFADLLRSGVVPTARLNTIHRQGEGSPVVTAAHAILAGNRPRDVKGSSEAFLFVPVPTDLDVMARALSVVQRSIPAKYGLATDAEIQVLSGTVLLSDELNAALARHFNTSAGPYLGAGDKVLHTKNNYELGVFNGDVGRCLLRDERGAQVEYDGRIVAEVLQLVVGGAGDGHGDHFVLQAGVRDRQQTLFERRSSDTITVRQHGDGDERVARQKHTLHGSTLTFMRRAELKESPTEAAKAATFVHQTRRCVR